MVKKTNFVEGYRNRIYCLHYIFLEVTRLFISIDKLWENNLMPIELHNIPHFYIQSGLRYKRMPFHNKVITKIFRYIMRKKNDKSLEEKQMEHAISSSYDISSKDDILIIIKVIRDGGIGETE